MRVLSFKNSNATIKNAALVLPKPAKRKRAVISDDKADHPTHHRHLSPPADSDNDVDNGEVNNSHIMDIDIIDDNDADDSGTKKKPRGSGSRGRYTRDDLSSAARSIFDMTCELYRASLAAKGPFQSAKDLDGLASTCLQEICVDVGYKVPSAEEYKIIVWLVSSIFNSTQALPHVLPSIHSSRSSSSVTRNSAASARM
jgi:hypothetical protein